MFGVKNFDSVKRLHKGDNFFYGGIYRMSDYMVLLKYKENKR